MTTSHHDYRGYVFTIDYQAQVPICTVDFPDFPDIITSGSTLSEAFANACEALDLHVESLQKLGMPIPKPTHRLVLAAGSRNKRGHGSQRDYRVDSTANLNQAITASACQPRRSPG
jgi:predicted RNase H-like HicB family nuclease